MDYLEIEQTYEEFTKLSLLLNKIEQSGLDDSRIIGSINSFNPTHYSDIVVNMIYKKTYKDSAVILDVQKLQDILEIEYMEVMFDGDPGDPRFFNKDLPNDFLSIRVGKDQIELDENGLLKKNIIPQLTQLETEDIETFYICNMIINFQLPQIPIIKDGNYHPVGIKEDIGTFIYMINLLDDNDTIIEGTDIINAAPINEILGSSDTDYNKLIYKWSENISMLYSGYITQDLNQYLDQNTIDTIQHVFSELLQVYTSTYVLIKEAIKFNEKIKNISDNESLKIYEHFKNIIGKDTTYSNKIKELQSKFYVSLTVFPVNIKNKIDNFNGNINIFELPKDIDKMLILYINKTVTTLKEFDDSHSFMEKVHEKGNLDYGQHRSMGVHLDFSRIDEIITPILTFITAYLELYLYHSIWKIMNIYSAIIKDKRIIVLKNKLIHLLFYYLYSYIQYNREYEQFKNMYTITKLLPEFIDYTKAFKNVYAKVLVMYEESEEDMWRSERRLIDYDWDKLRRELKSMSIEQMWDRAIEIGIPNEDILAAYRSAEGPARYITTERKHKLIKLISSNITKNNRDGHDISRRYDELRPYETTAQELSTSRFDTLRTRGNEWADRQNYIIQDHNTEYTDSIRRHQSYLPMGLQTESNRLRNSIKRSEIEDTPVMNLEGQHQLAQNTRAANFLQDISQYGGKRKTKKKQKAKKKQKKQRTKKKLLKK